MSDIDLYLDDKRRVLAERDARIRRGEVSPVPLSARATVEGRSGVRRIAIRRHAVITDSVPDSAGQDLGPGSPELQLGVLGSCLAHTVLIQAAQRNVPVSSLEVEVSASFDARRHGGIRAHSCSPTGPRLRGAPRLASRSGQRPCASRCSRAGLPDPQPAPPAPGRERAHPPFGAAP
ncbi:OsmC family protein [uncultured Methylobacterium sp.]|uniref:OsmC family protein n=1 Tax=uncultured Methylobacterium sp. TaxID=157278 RepID=UPI00338FDFF6